MRLLRFACAASVLFFFAAVARGEVQRATSDGFLVVFSRSIDAGPEKVFADLERIDRWWSSDHTYSGDAANLSLKAEAGGCWCERWSGGSVDHGRVILALPGRVLRVQTALGPLQQKAVSGVLNFQLKPEGKSTLLTVSYRVNGASASALDKDAPAVDKVLGEQLERLQRFIETGKAAAG